MQDQSFGIAVHLLPCKVIGDYDVLLIGNMAFTNACRGRGDAKSFNYALRGSPCQFNGIEMNVGQRRDIADGKAVFITLGIQFNEFSTISLTIEQHTILKAGGAIDTDLFEGVERSVLQVIDSAGTIGSPDIYRGKLFDSTENLYLCAMNNQGLLALAQLILPSEILSNFEVVRVVEEASLIRIYLDESVKAEYKENPEIESKGFCEAVTIRDFPIRDKGVDLIVRRRKWYDKQNNRYFSDSYELKAEGTRYSKEFAAFLKGVYGDDSYDLPFA